MQQITRKTRLLAALVAIAALAGCIKNPYWGNEAGVLLDGGGMTDSTRINVGVQTGEIGYMVNLQNRFSSEVPTTVTFAFNSAVLDQNARRILREQANWIRQFPEVRFKVFGHTDAVGTEAYNKRLGLRRARAVVRYLISQGISRSRLEAVVSYGETQPVIVTQGREPRNRRTVTEVTGFVQNHPMILNGKYAQVVFREYLVSGVPPSTLGQSLQSSGNGG